MKWLADEWLEDKPQPKDPNYTMVAPINLWSAMTTLESQNRRGEQLYPKVTDDDLRAFGWQARFYMQELNVQATDGGWLIRVFSCDMEGIGDEVILFVPKDALKPCEIRKDRCGRLEWHHS